MELVLVGPRGGRPLVNLQHFEAGSRGIIGAIRLIPIVAIRSPAAFLAALITILSFTVGPFVQQSIRTAARDVDLLGPDSVAAGVILARRKGYLVQDPGAPLRHLGSYT